MREKIDYLKKLNVFADLAEDELISLTKSADMLRCKRNTVVYVAHDPSDRVFVICDGRVKLSRSSAEGREVVLDILVTGELFGEMVICGESLRTHSAVAIDDSLLCALKRQDVEVVLQKNQDLAMQILCHVGDRCAELELRLEDQIFLPVEKRLLLTLFRQASRHGQRCVDGSVVIHLIQKDLAHLIGASRETVAELLATYKKKGVLHTGYRTIRLMDMDAITTALSVEGACDSRKVQSYSCGMGKTIRSTLAPK
jgi:CRP/FNR family transcriptional regulator